MSEQITLDAEARPASDDTAVIVSPQAAIARLKAAAEPVIEKRMAEWDAQIAPLVEKLKALPTPTTKTEADDIGVLRSEIVSLAKQIGDERLATTRPVDAFKNWIMGKAAPRIGDLDAAAVSAGEKIKTYQAAERAKAEAAAEAERQQRLAEARAKAAAEEAERKAEADRRAAEAKAEAERQAEIARKAAEADAARRAEEARKAAEIAAAAAKDQAEADRIRKAAEVQAAAEAEVAAEEAAAEAKRKAALLAQWDADEAAEEDAAAQARAEAALAAAAEPVKVETTRIAGTSTSEHYSFEILDENLVPRPYLMVDEKGLRRAIKEGIREIPGVRIFRSDIVRSR